MMKRDVTYTQDLIDLIAHIRNISPADLVERFEEASGLNIDDFISFPANFDGIFTAIDGSNAMVLESGSFSIAAIRAGASAYQDGCRRHRKITDLRLMRIGPEREVAAYDWLYEECFSYPPDTGLDSEDRSKAAAILRDTLEYYAAREALGSMNPDDVLILDGTLRVGHGSHFPVLTQVLQSAGMGGIHLGALAKQTSATWGGGLPLVLAVDRLAGYLGMRAPWYVHVPEEILDQRPYLQWQRGEVYITRLHTRSPTAFKVEIPRYASPESIERIFSACATYANDGRLAGYPYPLLDAHRMVTIREDTVDQIRHDVIRGMNRMGMNWSEFDELFGDYHDVFSRY